MTGTVRPTNRPTSCDQIPAALTTTSHGTVPCSVSTRATLRPSTLMPTTFTPVRIVTPRCRAQLADEARRVERGPARQLTPVEHEHVAAARDRQVVRDAAAGDAAADDDDAGGIDGGEARYPAVKPPSTTSSAPVMNEDSSLARHRAT